MSFLKAFQSDFYIVHFVKKFLQDFGEGCRGTAVQMLDRKGCSESDEEQEGEGSMLICISLRRRREEISQAEKD